eukprot:2815187-Rhodomonas_salina.2
MLWLRLKEARARFCGARVGYASGSHSASRSLQHEAVEDAASLRSALGPLASGVHLIGALLLLLDPVCYNYTPRRQIERAPYVCTGRRGAGA